MVSHNIEIAYEVIGVNMDKLIEFAMCGSEGRECNPYELVRPIERQRILLLINVKPLDVESIAKELNMSSECIVQHLEELKRCGLVREEGGLYRPSFAIFTLDDQRVLKQLIEELARDVVQVVNDWMPRIRKALNGLIVVRRGLRFAELEYIVVGALALDYQGLDVLSKEGLLIKSKKMPGGGEYVFAGFEVGLFDFKESWMWGHHSVFDGYWFNTHGKLPPRGRRFAFPDLAWLWYEQGMDLNKIVIKMVEIGDILNALLGRDLSFKELERELGIDEATLALDLSLLMAMNYVGVVRENVWRLSIPVLIAEEYEAIKQLSESMLRDVATRFSRKLDKIREVYSRTSPARNSIPLEEAFNQVYHLVFARALDELIVEGVIAEPPERVDGGKYAAFLIVLSRKS